MLIQGFYYLDLPSFNLGKTNEQTKNNGLMFGNAKALLLVLGQRVLVLYLRLDGRSRGSRMFLI
jgi:hypothetical protein